MEIQGHVFIVTGATSGIGLSAAKHLVARGGKVVIASRTESAVQQLAAELPESLGIPTDMTDYASIREMVAKAYSQFGRIDGLINNAGRSYEAAVEEIDPEIFDEIYRLNVIGPIVAMQAVIPIMRQQGGGSIVNINSGTAFMKVPRYGVYSSSKRALVGISLTAREELAPSKIVVSQVYPAVTATNFGVTRMGTRSTGGPSVDYSKGDSPDYIADLIVKAIEEGEAEYFAHDWMKTLEVRS